MRIRTYKLKQPPRWLPFHMREEESKLLEDILWRNVIEPLSSLWASGVLLDKKKDSIIYMLLYKLSSSEFGKVKRCKIIIYPTLMAWALQRGFLALDLWINYKRVEIEPLDNLKHKRSFFIFVLCRLVDGMWQQNLRGLW